LAVGRLAVGRLAAGPGPEAAGTLPPCAAQAHAATAGGRPA